MSRSRVVVMPACSARRRCLREVWAPIGASDGDIGHIGWLFLAGQRCHVQQLAGLPAPCRVERLWCSPVEHARSDGLCLGQGPLPREPRNHRICCAAITVYHFSPSIFPDCELALFALFRSPGYSAASGPASLLFARRCVPAVVLRHRMLAPIMEHENRLRAPRCEHMMATLDRARCGCEPADLQ